MISSNDRRFTGSIPQFYEDYLVPLIFEPYAADLAGRVATSAASRVLEIASGTGVVTRHLAAELDPRVSIVATDINESMLEHAASVGTSRPVERKTADAMDLPFYDESFDTVVCQFGVMFFPDKRRAFAEARRVLRSGGRFLFNVWDRIEDNEFADVVTRSLERLFPSDPPRFLARIPHGYHDVALITRDLESARFGSAANVTTIAERSRAASARVPALAYCEGTPLRNEIEARNPTKLAQATDAATTAIEERFGSGAVDGKIQAHIFEVARS